MARLLINGIYVGRYNNTYEAKEVAKFYFSIKHKHYSDMVLVESEGKVLQAIVGYHSNKVIFI